MSKLQKCYQVCKGVGYGKKYLTNKQFCNEKLIKPLAGPRGQHCELSVTIHHIMGAIMDAKIQEEYAEKVTRWVAQVEYKGLRERKAEEILTLGTIYFYLGSKIKIVFYVEPYGREAEFG